MGKEFTEEDDALLSKLGVQPTTSKVGGFTARQERMIADFEEVQTFVREHERLPQHGEHGDIFERTYAIRLDRIRASAESTELLRPVDSLGLLDGDANPPISLDYPSDDDLLDALGVESGATPEADLTQLKYVRSREEINAAAEFARRTPCEDFGRYEGAFKRVQEELKSGTRGTVKHRDDFEPRTGEMYIIAGQKALIAEMGEKFTTDYGRTDRRLRVIYDNGTESDLLLRSLQRALNRDSASRRILPLDTEALPLFSNEIRAEDSQSGHIYVLRSLSDHPFIVEHRELIHKIGVTGQDVKGRIARASSDPTFLLAEVELVGSYQLANINRRKLERILHRFFAEVQMDVELRDRFSNPVEPREWFLAPLPVIRRAIDLLMSGEIENCRYNPTNAQIIDVRTGKPPQ